MYFCFIDESGSIPKIEQTEGAYFTFGAVIVNCEQWHEIDNILKTFKKENDIGQKEIKWTWFAPQNTSEKNPFKDKTPEEKKELSIKFSHLIATMPITIVCCITDLNAAVKYKRIKTQPDLYNFCYKPITERFQYFLQEKDSYGMVIADHRGKNDDRLFRANHKELVESKRKTHSSYTKLLEGLFLQDSSLSTGIQIADFVAGAIHRAFCHADGERAAILKPLFRRNSSNIIEGYGMVTNPKSHFKKPC